MKETTITTTEDAWQCEVCRHEHTDEWGGKWAIFHCPLHGEFCNDGLHNCGLYRYVESHGRDQICCPICGWVAKDDWTEKYDERKDEKGLFKMVEVYDKRTGTFPKTEKELKSFYRDQDYVLQHPEGFSGMMSYRRLMEY